MLKYLLCIILGIIIYLLLNHRESFSIGSVRVDLWRNTETGLYTLINRGAEGGFSPQGWEIIAEDKDITDDQFRRILEIIEEHPCEDPIGLFNEEDARLARQARAIPEGVPPGVLECKINKTIQGHGWGAGWAPRLAELLQPLYDHQALPRRAEPPG